LAVVNESLTERRDKIRNGIVWWQSVF
jgi:hypothetical protein